MEQSKCESLVAQKKALEEKLATLLYGAFEKRDSGEKAYAYLHRREDGIRVTKYIGEFSEKLLKTVANDNAEAKEIKKQLRQINKELNTLGFTEQEMDEKVAINIALARRYLVENVHKLAALEGIATTLADTERILEGGRVGDLTATDTNKIINLKRAWEFVLNKFVIQTPFSFNIVSEVNRLVEEGFHTLGGKVRSVPVTIGGTDYKPPLPIETVVKEEIDEILNNNCSLEDKVISLILYLMKRQIFIDGNKRTAVISANHLFISMGGGLLAIPADKTDEYKKLLVKYYEAERSEDKDTKNIIKFLKEYCITRI